jgi:hypothetical protein
MESTQAKKKWSHIYKNYRKYQKYLCSYGFGHKSVIDLFAVYRDRKKKRWCVRLRDIEILRAILFPNKYAMVGIFELESNLLLLRTKYVGLIREATADGLWLWSQSENAPVLLPFGAVVFEYSYSDVDSVSQFDGMFALCEDLLKEFRPEDFVMYVQLPSRKFLRKTYIQSNLDVDADKLVDRDPCKDHRV